jgi:sterol 14-demethylase
MPALEGAIKEALRLHPPLILLMRKVVRDFHFGEWAVEAGKTLAVSPAISNRMPEYFPQPDSFDPSRYGPGRQEDRQSFAWIPFGAGRHRCVGAAFAMMQLKAIFSVLLRRFDFELTQPPQSYRNDHSKMVVQLGQPCRVGVRPRRARISPATARSQTEDTSAAGALRIAIDLDLCQGHGVCVSEAPAVFGLDRAELKVRLLCEAPGEDLHAGVRAAVQHCPTGALRIHKTPPE